MTYNQTLLRRFSKTPEQMSPQELERVKQLIPDSPTNTPEIITKEERMTKKETKKKTREEEKWKTKEKKRKEKGETERLIANIREAIKETEWHREENTRRQQTEAMSKIDTEKLERSTLAILFIDPSEAQKKLDERLSHLPPERQEWIVEEIKFQIKDSDIRSKWPGGILPLFILDNELDTILQDNKRVLLDNKRKLPQSERSRTDDEIRTPSDDYLHTAE